MNQFSNFLRFLPLTGTNRSLHTITSLACLPARVGDHYRLLIPKTDLLGLVPELCKVVLVQEKKDTTGYDRLGDVGSVRVQQSELYTHLKLLVNDLPTAQSYRQFSLARADGQQVIGTFRGQQTGQAAYMVALKNFFEGFPYAPVLAEVNGNVLSLRIFRTGRFRMTDEPLQVGLGTVLESNENNPSIKAVQLNTVIQPPQTLYKLRVGKDIQAGNIFILNGVRYTALTGDTEEKILTSINGGSTLFQVEAGTLGETQALAGERTLQNTTKPTVVAQFVSNDVTYEYYSIKVLGNWQKGNVIQVTATGKTTITRTVTDTDTVGSLEAALNPDTGQYRTNSGVVPVITVLAGSQKIANTNYPSLTAQVEEQIPEILLRRWQINVSPDVVAGNEYILEDQSYTAAEGDSAAAVSLKLGLTGAYSVITRPDGQPVLAYARKGSKYNSSHTADIKILEGPFIRKSRQAVLEVVIPEQEKGAYQLGLVDIRTDELVGVSNYLRIGDNALDCMLEVNAYQEAFGYEYHEPGLTQRLRLPVSLGTAQPFLESETQVGLDGYQRKRSVRISQTVELVSDAVKEEFCSTLTAWLQHEEVVIEGTEYSMREGMEPAILSNHSRTLQFSTKLIASGQVSHNRGRYLSPAQLGFGRLEWLPPTYGVQLYLIGTDGEILPIVREMSVRAGEYQLEVIGAADACTVEVFVNGGSSTLFIAPRLVRSRPASLVRVEAHGLTSLKLTPVREADVVETCQVIVQHESVEYSCEVVQKEALNEFSDDFSEDFTI